MIDPSLLSSRKVANSYDCLIYQKSFRIAKIAFSSAKQLFSIVVSGNREHSFVLKFAYMIFSSPCSFAYI